MQMLRCIGLVLALTLVQAAITDGTATEVREDDPSMLLFHAAGVELASREIALALAEMIFKTVYGDEDFQTQTPLRAEDGGDRWVIEGSRRAEDYPVRPGQASEGKVQIVILKSNCQVVKLSQKGHLPSK
jgi:hypothetical protein